MTRVARSLPLALCCCAALAVAPATAPAAPASADAPRVDPNSPAGTEYELPIQRARERAGVGVGATTPGREPPLFGAGVETRAAPGTRPAGARGTGSPAGSRADRPQPDAQTVTETVRSQSAEPAGSGLLPVGAGAAGVLLIGGVAGVAWRRRSNRGLSG